MSLARRLRVQAAKARGIRVVPENPDRREFPKRVFACDLRPGLCSLCLMPSCPYGVRP